MKKSRILFLAACGLISLDAARAYDPVKGLARTEVVFFEPEKFTDVRENGLSDSEKDRTAILGELRAHIIKSANRLLAAGQQLKITITDVDLAGEFEPWRGGSMADIRIVKDIYAPDIKLSFQLTAQDGTVIKQGDRHLRDMGFMMSLSIDKNDSRRYEKEMLDNWLRQELRGLKNKGT